MMFRLFLNLYFFYLNFALVYYCCVHSFFSLAFVSRSLCVASADTFKYAIYWLFKMILPFGMSIWRSRSYPFDSLEVFPFNFSMMFHFQSFFISRVLLLRMLYILVLALDAFLDPKKWVQITALWSMCGFTFDKIPFTFIYSKVQLKFFLLYRFKSIHKGRKSPILVSRSVFSSFV